MLFAWRREVGDAVLITTTRLVYGERREDRNCGEEDRLGNAVVPSATVANSESLEGYYKY